MNRGNRIVSDPNVLAGKPVVKGTRLAVEFIVGLSANGRTEGQILDCCPGLEREDVEACRTYTEEFPPLTASQKEELDRRLEAHRRDPNAGLPWEEVRARILEGRK